MLFWINSQNPRRKISFKAYKRKTDYWHNVLVLCKKREKEKQNKPGGGGGPGGPPGPPNGGGGGGTNPPIPGGGGGGPKPGGAGGGGGMGPLGEVAAAAATIEGGNAPMLAKLAILASSGIEAPTSFTTSSSFMRDTISTLSCCSSFCAFAKSSSHRLRVSSWSFTYRAYQPFFRSCFAFRPFRFLVSLVWQQYRL